MKAGTEIKTPAQIEFQELFERAKTLGLKAADVARKLKYKGGGAVSMLLKGKTGITDIRLQIFREWIEEMEQAKAKGLSIEARFDDIESLNERLEFLREKDPSRYESAKAVITSLHEHAVKGVSSTVASVAVGSQADALAAAQSESQSPSPKPGAVEPSARKRGPRRGAGLGAKGKHASPGPAPK